MKKYFPLILILSLLLPLIFAPSCANTTQAPTGGKKDTIPPRIVMIKPLPRSVNVPCKGASVVFEFNEYVTIKNSKNIFLSPPQAKAPKSKVVGKTVVVTFEEDLEPETCYTLNLTGAIADNNEGNMFPGFTYVFSTGSVIDSMYITGKVVDCSTLQPVKDATVMLYKDHSDSAIFLHRPDAAVKTDDWGFFAMPYIQDTLYRLYAIVDADANNIYDPENDRVAFNDSIVRPVRIVNDSVAELKKYDMKDTVAVRKRVTDYELSVFRESQTRQYLRNQGRIGAKVGFISFNAADAWIDSLWIKGYKPENVITMFNQSQDSLLLWLNDRRYAPDTLNVMVSYRKTDSLGLMVPALEEVKLFEENGTKNMYSKRKRVDQMEHKDTICAFTFKADPATLEQEGFLLEFPLPIVVARFDSVKCWSIDPREQERELEFDIECDTLDIRRFRLKPKTRYLAGHEYRFKIPERTFCNIDGFWSDSLIVKSSLPNDDKLSTLNIVVSNVRCRVIVDLLDASGKKTLRSYTIDNDQTLSFPYLAPGKYSVRFTEDINGNSMVDSGSILEHRQSEKVRFLKIGEENLIEIIEKSTIEQTIDCLEIFK